MSSSDSGWIPIALPTEWVKPLQELAGLYREHGSIPRLVAAIISTYIVESVFGLGSYVVASVLWVYDWLVLSITSVRTLLGGAFGGVGVNILGGLRWVQLELASAVMAAGPLGPPIAIAVASVTLVVLYRATIAVLGELPVGSSLVDFLGLR